MTFMTIFYLNGMILVLGFELQNEYNINSLMIKLDKKKCI